MKLDGVKQTETLLIFNTFNNLLAQII